MQGLIQSTMGWKTRKSASRDTCDDSSPSESPLEARQTSIMKQRTESSKHLTRVHPVRTHTPKITQHFHWIQCAHRGRHCEPEMDEAKLKIFNMCQMLIPSLGNATGQKKTKNHWENHLNHSFKTQSFGEDEGNYSCWRGKIAAKQRQSKQTEALPPEQSKIQTHPVTDGTIQVAPVLPHLSSGRSAGQRPASGLPCYEVGNLIQQQFLTCGPSSNVL